MHHPTDRIAPTVAFLTPVVEHWLVGEIIAQWLHIKYQSTQLQSDYELVVHKNAASDLIPFGTIQF